MTPSQTRLFAKIPPGPAANRSLFEAERFDPKKEPPRPLTPQEIENIERNIELARKTIEGFVKNPTLAHAYAGHESFRTWKGLADGKVVLGFGLSTRVNRYALGLKDIIQAVVPTQHEGVAFRGPIVREKVDLEIRKATAVGALAEAGSKLLTEFPLETAHYNYMRQFMDDSIGKSSRWLARLDAEARNVGTTPVSRLQHSLF